MTNPVKDRSGVGLPPKAERRAAGKLAAKKRAQAKRRKRIINNTLVGASGVAVLALLLFVFGVFDDDPATGPQANPSASADTGNQSEAGSGQQLPADADPALQTKPTVTAGDGSPLTELKITPLITGTGAAVEDGQTIMVNYVGVNYATGEEFDTSFGKQPFSFTIGRGEVIKGWDQGLLNVPVGSRVQLDIPAELAYGEGDGPTGGPLRFVVDVLSTS